MDRCSKCVLPKGYPDLVFDKAGVCSKCHEHERLFLRRDYAKLSARLEGLVNWAKGQKKRYDCIVPFSGGKDSSYTLYLCRKKFGMKVLAVNFNNGLRTLEALKNMENIVKQSDCGFVCYGPSWETMKKLYRRFFQLTGQFCFPCDMGIWATVHRVAEQYDVPLIVSGFSSQIESRGPKIYSYNNNLFRRIAKEVLSKGEMIDFLGISNSEKLARRFRRLRPSRYRRQISLPDYMVWDDREIKSTIYSELGWEKREDGSSDHIDCLFAPIKNYLVVQKWGFGEKTTKYSAMIRAGQMDRETALKACAEEYEKNEKTLELFKEMLDLNDNDLRQAREKSHLPFLKKR